MKKIITYEYKQAKWILLILGFFTGVALIYPLQLLLLIQVNNENLTDNNLVFPGELILLSSAILSVIPVCICIYIQDNWSNSTKFKVSLINIIYFFIISRFTSSIVMILLFPLLIILPIVTSLLIYNLVIKYYHKKYSYIKEINVDTDFIKLLRNTYISLSVTFVMICIVSFITYTGTTISNDIFSYNTLNSIKISIPLICIFLSILFSLPVQILIFKQKNWNLYSKIINTVFVNLIFSILGFIVNKLLEIFIFGCASIPFIPIICSILLEYVFVKSNLKTSAKYIEEQEKGA